MAIKKSAAVRNAELDVLETVVGVSPTLEIRSGPPPAATTDADSGTLLCTIPLPSDWAAAASGGSKAKAGAWEADASAAGTAGHFRLKASDSTVHYQGTITATGGGGDMEMVNTSIAVDQPVTVTTFTRTAAGA